MALSKRSSSTRTSNFTPRTCWRSRSPQVARRYVLTGAIGSDRGDRAIADLRDLDIVRQAHEPLLATIWNVRDNVTAYDGAYVALALALACPLVTFDARLADAPHGAIVELLG